MKYFIYEGCKIFRQMFSITNDDAVLFQFFVNMTNKSITKSYKFGKILLTIKH